MAKIAKQLTELVGNTPLLQLNAYSAKENLQTNIIAKLEYFNPAGSVKDRIALAMIQDAEKRGIIKPGATIIEPTSGNTGVGLAFVSAVKGYKLILTMPETMSIERRNLVKAYLTTGPEIFEQLSGRVDIFVAGVGTGGTVSGIGKRLKELKPDVKIVAVEPESSAVLSGEAPGAHKIQGIGAGFVPKTFDRNAVDEIFKVPNDAAILTSRKIAANEGLLVGISSGASAYAATELAKDPANKGKVIVALLPDTGERYLSTILYDCENYPL